MILQEFYNLYKGKENVGNTPGNRGQCVGLVSLWMDNFDVPHVWGHAKDLYKNAPSEYFQKIPNTPDAIVQDGDIVVWNAGYNGTYGHTGIAKGKHDINSFEVFQQNDPLGSTPHIKKYNYAYVIGWLRPRALPANDTMVIKKEVFEALVTKATAYDNLLVEHKNNEQTVLQKQERIEGLEGENKELTDDVEQLGRINKDLQTKLEKCEGNIQKPPKAPSQDVKVNPKPNPSILIRLFNFFKRWSK